MKSFGRRQAYESPRGRNPRGTVDGYGDFELRPVSAMERPALGRAMVDADGPLRCSFAQYWLPGAGPGGRVSASVITPGARGSDAGGRAPAAEGVRQQMI